MSPRPRRLPDSAILSAAAKVVSKTGPERFTLADVGQEVGLSAATLVQRFGSKRLLMLAMLEQMTSIVNGRFTAKLTEGESPLDSLYAAALDRADPTHGPEQVANGIAFLLMEINDPEFHAIAIEGAKKAVGAYKCRLDEAIEDGDLTDTGIDTLELAETIHSMTLGSLMMWVINREADTKPRTRRDLDTLLRPYRRVSHKSSARHNHDRSHNHDGKATGPKSVTPAPVIAD
jgi:AcrR family transcriptional regulator